MPQENLLKLTDVAPAKPELTELQPEVAKIIAVLDQDPNTLATGDVRYEWGTRNGKRLDRGEQSGFTIENTVTTFGHDAVDAMTQRVQDVSVILRNPPKLIAGIDGHISGVTYDVTIEGLRATYFRTARVLHNNRVDTVRHALETPSELAELGSVLNAALSEVGGIQ